MKKERRWLKSAIAASAEPQIALPWQRGARRRPQSLRDVAAKAAPPPVPAAMAAH